MPKKKSVRRRLNWSKVRLQHVEHKEPEPADIEQQYTCWGTPVVKRTKPRILEQGEEEQAEHEHNNKKSYRRALYFSMPSPPRTTVDEDEDDELETKRPFNKYLEPYKVKLCRFYHSPKLTCTRGDACTFIHDENMPKTKKNKLFINYRNSKYKSICFC